MRRGEDGTRTIYMREGAVDCSVVSRGMDEDVGTSHRRNVPTGSGSPFHRYAGASFETLRSRGSRNRIGVRETGRIKLRRLALAYSGFNEARLRKGSSQERYSII